MKKNFLIDQAVALICEGHYFDLHNCYDFTGFNFEVARKTFCLNFIRTLDSEGSAGSVSIKFVGADIIEISKGFFNHINSNLSEVGYKPPDDQDHDWLVDDRRSSSEDHLFFRFEKDQYIRIHGRYAIVEFCN